MNAYLKRVFKGGFILSEENIVKLNDIINKRIVEANIDPEYVKYRVFRKDALVYTTSDHSEIIREENSTFNLITKLEVMIKSDALDFNLSFAKNEATLLLVEAVNKDLAYLIFSDTKDYLTDEVVKYKISDISNSKFTRLIVPVFMMLIIAVMFLSIKGPMFNDAQFQRLLDNGSVDDKLDYMLRSGRRQMNVSNFKYIFIAFFIFSIGAELIVAIISKLFPRDVFYWGKEIQRFDRAIRSRNKILWGIGIAFVVGVLASLVANLIPVR
jgi:hypothetical protein